MLWLDLIGWAELHSIFVTCWTLFSGVVQCG